MNLAKKRDLAARTLEVGKDRIVFNQERLNDIKEAITKLDIRQLVEEKAILVKAERGIKKKIKRKTRRRVGSVRKKVNEGKREYVLLTRRMRSYLKELKKKDKIGKNDYLALRRGIRARTFKNKAHLREILNSQEKKE